ncbi:hypothetical protein ACIA03_13050 [Nocardioides sp. NPDC051685]|uniref:hypothetical protein n=1 Tax=Nocardioides sp. NPDC051685 TaxID=3364334 RepID=UPI00378C0E7B
MNIANTRRAATTFATTAAIAGVLTIMSAVAPATANAHPVLPIPDPATRCVETVDDAVGSSTASMDIDQIVTMLKVRRAAYLNDHPLLLR